MSDVLVLIGGDAPGAPFAWACVDGAGNITRRGITSESSPPAFPPGRTILVLPAADARLRRLELPARSDTQARAGAEMLFGGTLSSGEAMHYAVGAQQNDAGARLVAAISCDRLRQWLDACRTLRAEPHLVALDCTVWRHVDDAIVVAVTPNRVIVTGGPAGGFSIEPSLAPSLLARWIDEAEVEGWRIIVEGGDADVYRSAVGAAIQSAPLPDPIATIAVTAAEPAPFAPNLRQGAFAAEHREAQPFRLWRFAALLAAAAILLQIGSLLISGWRDHQAATQILASAERDFRQARPDVGRIVNLRAQVSGLANAIEQAGRHPVLLTSQPIIEALRRHPLTRVDEVRHQRSERAVRLTVSAPQPAQLEGFVGSLREQGVTLEAANAQPRDGRYVAELTLETP